jgi:hypothetical protein
MKDRKPVESSGELFDRISRLTAEMEWSIEESREALLEAGIDPDKLVSNVLANVKGALKGSPEYWRNRAKAQREYLLEKIRKAATTTQEKLTRDELLRRIRETIARLPASVSQEYAVAFRKFEDCSEEDLASLLQELEIIEKLNRDNKE